MTVHKTAGESTETPRTTSSRTPHTKGRVVMKLKSISDRVITREAKKVVAASLTAVLRTLYRDYFLHPAGLPSAEALPLFQWRPEPRVSSSNSQHHSFQAERLLGIPRQPALSNSALNSPQPVQRLNSSGGMEAARLGNCIPKSSVTASRCTR